MTQTTESLTAFGASIARPSGFGPIGTDGARADRVAQLPAEAGLWRLEGLLGEGSLARVFCARPVGSPTDRPAPYALKMLHPRWEDHPEVLALLRREAVVGRAVSHPHLISVLAAQVHEPPYFVVMPRLSGQTLAARLKRGGPLSVAMAIWIARQMAQALDALHQQGFLHGDVKPANIFLAQSGHATLLDLGFAQRFEETGSVVNRPLLGTINYLAPELLISALRADHRSDIFSLGVVLFEMLIGRPPLAAQDLVDLMRLLRESRPPNLRASRPELPQPLSNLARRMMSKEPLRRPRSMDEIIRRLVALEIETLPERLA
jgi:serine/threonine protein kinase